MTDDYFDDAIGEIGNIMMGAGATNLAALLGVPVSITTPRVDVGLPELGWPQGRTVVVRINMSGVLSGNSLFVLPAEQVEEIVQLMTAGMDLGDAALDDGDLLGELGLSAIGEAMNQLIAGAAHALGEILGGIVEITPPDLEIVDGSTFEPALEPDSTCMVTFDVAIGPETQGQLSWLMDREMAGDLIARIEAGMSGPAPSAPSAPAAAPSGAHASAPHAAPSVSSVAVLDPPVEVAPATYPEFGPGPGNGTGADLSMISDVSLTVTVELGRTRIKVKELLSLGQGSVLEIDRAAGAPVDILVNGTLVARGDVVVVDDELGVRVSEVIDPKERNTF